MIQIAHLLDDFGMGGVTRALTLFDQPTLTRVAHSQVVSVASDARLAPSIKADLIVDHMALSWTRLVFLASLRARNPRAHIVHVEHSYTRAFESTYVPHQRRFRTMLKLASTLVDDVVCVSEAQRGWLENQVGIASDKLRVIYPWTDQSKLFDVPRKPVTRCAPMQLLAYGRYAKIKNFDTLIAAMDGIPSGMVELTLFGDGPERGALEALASDLPNVRVLGPSSNPAAHLKAADAVVIPSQYEAFGLVATEARMAGRAILVADTDGLPEQVGQGGLVAPMRTPDEIRDAIFRLAHHDLAQMGRDGRRQVRNQSSEIILRWLRLIKQVESKQTRIKRGSTKPHLHGALG